MNRLAWTRTRIGASSLFETASDVTRLIATVDAQIVAIDRDVMAWAAAKYGPSVWSTIPTGDRGDFDANKLLYRSFYEWKERWNAYKAEWAAKWISIMSADTYREVQGWQAEANAWRERWAKRGVTMTGMVPTPTSPIPGIIPVKHPEDPNAVDTVSGLKTAAIVAVVVVGGVLAIQALRTVKSVIPTVPAMPKEEPAS